MQDRDAQQRPAIVELVELERRAGKDLAWIVAVCVVLIALAVAADAFSRLQAATGTTTVRDLDGLVALLVVAPVGSSVYAMRRYREGMQAQRTLAGLTVHDTLTGLPNRRFLGESFERMLADHRRSGLGKLVVLFVDLDRFKAVNDTYGHEVGDHLMRAVAERLVRAVRESDVVIRYAGDEFVVLTGGVPNPGVAERIASRLIHLLELPFELGQDRIQISASVGIAVDDGIATTDDLVRDADAAMYQAKAHGSGTYALFDCSMRDRLTPATARRRMQDAIDAGEFQVRYRPILSLAGHEVVAVEATLRWDEPQRGEIRSEEFLAALEDTGLIVPVGDWLLRQACRQSRAWALAFPDRPPLSVLVPVAPRQLSQSDVVERLLQLLDESGASPDTIVLCVDQRSLTDDMGMLRQTLRAARGIGVRVALTDRSVGLAALGHVRTVDIDVLCVDGAEVAAAVEDRRDAAVARHVFGLARALGVVTIATGVSRDAHAEVVRSLGCDLVGGDRVGRALTAEAVEELLGRRAPAAADLQRT